MGKHWRVGLAGLGTVGMGLAALLAERPSFAPVGGEVRLSGVSARTRGRQRSTDIAHLPWFDDPGELAVSPTNDIFVELIGGEEGPARSAVEAALEIGKPVITGNKALIARHGAHLAALAERNGAPLLFEAAVMGGTPAVKLVRESLAGDEVLSVAGILNGTSNFILSRMETSGAGFAEALGEAQALGYAEADPSLDIGGWDAAHKITILAALAFGRAPSLAATEVRGLHGIERLDSRLAESLGYRIRLLAQAIRGDEAVAVRVGPALAPRDHPLASVEGAANAVVIEARRSGRIFLQGAGAGAGPTAAAVAADIADVMAGGRRPVFQRAAATLRGWDRAGGGETIGRIYLRMRVRDEPGVIAAVTEALAHESVSIDTLLQRRIDGVEGMPIVLTTHPAAERALAAATERVARLPALLDPPRSLPIARL